MSTGKINVQTENIFPIIKKFLYSDHEIFLRELVSNAVDATQKLKTLVSLGESKATLGDLKVEVVIDKAAKTLTIKDKGIGMTAEEIEKYITQIAFSGAEEFVNKYKDKTPEANAIIGHFGLGFYSAFMVAKKVEIISLSHKEGAQAVRWECDGSPEYKLEDTTKSERGTDIVLHIADDSEEFLEDYRISSLLTKYCKFLPVEIKFGTRKEGEKDKEVEVDNIINNPSPAWTKKPADLKDEDYKNFYRELYPMNFE
ncbi:MAG: ATP-binding protein, partial [Bacteroidia bacterium]|nr:ATP-binding protein [Bacteroidia bacterium]